MARLARHGRPQANRAALHRHRVRVPAARRRRGARDAHPAGAAECDRAHARAVRLAVHDARRHDDLPVRAARAVRLCELPVAADARLARHGIPEAERVFLLGVPVRRPVPVCELSARRGAGRRLVQLRAAHVARLQRRREHRHLRARHDPARHLDDRRRRQLRRHAAAHARARDVDRPPADHRLGHAHRIGREPRRGAVREPRVPAAVARPQCRHALLRRRERRAAAVVAAPVLDVRAPVGLRGRAARDGDRVGRAADLLPAAARRIRSRRGIDGRDDADRLRGVGPPHVRDRHRAARASRSSARRAC